MTPSDAVVTNAAAPTPVEAPPDHHDSANDLRTAGRNMVTLGSSLILTWSIALFVRFQLPRALGPELFGAFNFADAFSAAFFTLAELGIDTYIVREVSVRPKHASDFAGGVLVVRLLATVLLSLAMFITLTITGRPMIMRYAVLMFGLVQISMINNSSMAALLQAATKVKRLAVANVLSKVIWGLGLTVVIFYKAPLPVLVLPLLVSEWLKSSMLIPVVRRETKLQLRIDPAATKAALIASLPFFLNSGAITIGSRLTMASLEFATTDKREVGWFGAAGNLAGLAMLLSPLVGWVMMPLLAKARSRSEEEAFAILRRALEFLLVLMVPVTLFISLGADDIVRLAFGSKFAESAASLRVLAFDFLPMYIAIMCSVMLMLNGRHWSVTLTTLALIPIRAALIIPMATGFSRLLGTGGAAVGASATEVISVSVSAVVALYMCGRRAVDRRSALAVGKSIVAAAIVVALDRYLTHLGLVRLALDMFAYVVLALLIRVVSIADIKSLIGILRTSRAG